MKEEEMQLKQEQELKATLLACLVSGLLAGVWSGNQPGVAIIRDSFGFESWGGQSLWEHMVAGTLIALVWGFIMALLARPISKCFRALAGRTCEEPIVQFTMNWGARVGMGAGSLAGAILALEPDGSWIDPTGFLFWFYFPQLRRMDGEFGFLLGGMAGYLFLGLIFALLSRVILSKPRT